MKHDWVGFGNSVEYCRRCGLMLNPTTRYRDCNFLCTIDDVALLAKKLVDIRFKAVEAEIQKNREIILDLQTKTDIVIQLVRERFKQS